MPLKLNSSLVLILTFLTACSKDNPDEFTASGIIEGTAVKVSAQTGGKILQIRVDEGDEVEPGQGIAVIDAEKLVYQLEGVQAALEELKVQRQINRNSLDKAKSDAEHIKKKYQRYQELYKQNSVSEQILEDLEQAYDSAKTQLENVEQNLMVIESKQKGLDAQRKLLERQIRDATVTAPLSGTITTKYFQEGETIAAGFALVEIIDLNKMWTKVYVSELILPKIKLGQQAEVRVDGTDKTLTGRVSWISPKAEFTPKNILTEESRTSLVYAVKVRVENPDQVLKHGMPVEVALKF